MNSFIQLLFLLLNLSIVPGFSATPSTISLDNPQAAGPMVMPEIFAPGVISGPANNGSPTFTPGDTTLFFTRGGAAAWSVILESHRVGNNWSKPQIAPFSGEWSDAQPVLSSDGSYLVFASVRPAPGSSAGGARISHLWRVDLKGGKAGNPVLLPDTVNISPRIFRPSLASEGTLYFMAMEPGKKFRLFFAQYSNGNYQPAEPLPFSDGSTSDVDPEIAPDNSFLIFSSDGRTPGDESHEHLFIVLRKGDSWGPVSRIHYEGDNGRPSNDNDARVSRDGRTLYFSSDRTVPVQFPLNHEQAEQELKRLEDWNNGKANVWTTPLAPIVDAARKAH